MQEKSSFHLGYRYGQWKILITATAQQLSGSGMMHRKGSCE